MSQKGRPLDSQKMARVSPIHISSGDFGGCHVSRHAISSEICEVGLATRCGFYRFLGLVSPAFFGVPYRSQFPVANNGPVEMSGFPLNMRLSHHPIIPWNPPKEQTVNVQNIHSGSPNFFDNGNWQLRFGSAMASYRETQRHSLIWSPLGFGDQLLS